MTSSTPILIRNGHVIDPAQGIDRTADLVIEDGRILGVDNGIENEQAEVIDAAGLVVCPGFVDLHCHLREPGFEHKETIATGTRAAARGGFTTVCAMPNTDPVIDSRAVVDFVLSKGRNEGAVRVLPIGSVTKGSLGAQLSEMGELSDAGVVGFSDDGLPVHDANVMRQALTYSSSFGLPIINHCEVTELSRQGLANEGWVSSLLGVPGIPGSAEEIMVARDIALAEMTGGRLHVAHASTAGTVELVRQAKARGTANVTCEVTPHHLTLSDETLLGPDGAAAFERLTPDAYDSNAKVAPPLRAPLDVEAMVWGLVDGTIDVIATDHAPHSAVDKLCTLHDAANGISNLETALGSLMSLVHAGAVDLPLLVEKLTSAPAAILGMDIGSLKPGAPADVTIFDPDAEWVVDPSQFASKGKNTPLAGRTLKGKVVATIFAGGVVYHDEQRIGEG